MLTASRPVMPWMMKVVSFVIRMDMPSPRPSPCAGRGSRRRHLRYRPSGCVEHGYGAIAIFHAVVLQDLEALGLPRSGDAEDGDLLSRLEARFDHALDDAASDDIDARVRHHVHHHGDLLHAWLGQDRFPQLAGF